MFETEYLLFCEQSILDINSRVSLINIFDNISAPSFPARSNKFVVAFRIRTKKGQKYNNKSVKLRISITSPDGKEIGMLTGDSQPVMLDEEMDMISSVDISGVTFNEKGKYTLHFAINDVEIGQKVFQVATDAKK